MHVVEQGDGCPAGAHAGQLVFDMLEDAVLIRLLTSANNPFRSLTSIVDLLAVHAVTIEPIGLAHDGAAQVAGRPQVEDDDGEAIVHAQRDRRGVHHPQSLVDDFEIGNPVEPRGALVDHRVGRVDAVDLRALQDDVGLHLHGAERRRGIGREVWVARAGGKNDDAALFRGGGSPGGG